jgi:methionyl-tRNA formyltransferase
MKIAFFGTADFAVASLEALQQAGHHIVAIVTAPDKPAGRGLKLTQSPVKQAAERLSLPVLQPEKLRDLGFQAEIKALNPRLGIVVAFRMMPESLWSMPELGTVNLHGSLLPNYRGAAPIHWAVANGEAVTGVTTFFLRHEIDTGDLIFQEEEPIAPDDTTGQVYERLMHRGAALLAKTVKAIQDGNAPRLPQKTGQALRHAPKITPENSRIDWARTGLEIKNLVRGMNPFPTAWTTVDGKHVRLFKVEPVGPDGIEPNADHGTIHIDKGRLFAASGDGWVEILEIQLEGKKRMPARDLLNGWRPAETSFQ